MTNEILTPKIKPVNHTFINILLSGVAGILILLVLAQSFQLQKLQGYAQGLALAGGVNTAAVVPPQPTGATPTRSSSLPVRPAPATSGLPSQVGGC